MDNPDSTQNDEVAALPAATVTLVRDAKGGIEVLMLQRNLKSGFVPGAFVFPGGAVDPVDGSDEMGALCSGISDVEASRALRVQRGGLAYWAAAVRESFEEAGLLLAYDGLRQLVNLDDPVLAERMRDHRHQLNRGAGTLIDILRSESLMLAADRLVYFSHWITPVTAPRRYDTRFFVAAAPARQSPLQDDQEIISHLWISPSEALDRHRNKTFKLRFPTMRTLEEFAAYSSVATLMAAMRAKPEIPAILPRVSKAGGRLLPGDPGYDEMVRRELQRQWKA